MQNLKIGDNFKLLNLNWTILDITDKGYMCLAERLDEDMQFDSVCNNWKTSDLRNYLNTEFLNKLVAEIGAENIVVFERNLASTKGHVEYGICEDKISLFTKDEYVKYRKLIPDWEKYRGWSITPSDDLYDDIAYDDSIYVHSFLSPRGFSRPRVRHSDYYDVHPLCIFSWKIFAKILTAEEYDREVCERKCDTDYAGGTGMNEVWKQIFNGYVESYKAIQTLQKNGLLDEEEKAVHEHNLLCEIIGTMESEIKEDA